MNDLTSMKQRLISALDKSDTPKKFIFNIFEEVYQQGYEDGISVIEQIKAEIKNYLEDEKCSENGVSDVGIGLELSLNIINKVVKECEA